MNRRTFLKMSGIGAIGIPLFCTAEMTKPRRPNIVFFLSDDQPTRAMSKNDPWFSTPNLDKLAVEGIEFKNAFVTTSICCVSRASFFTGQHSLRHGVNSFDTPLTTEQMGQTYAGLLRQAGYRTAFLGKYAIGHSRAAPRELCLPKDQFDLWYGFQQSPSYSQTINGKKRYITSVMEEKAVRFMNETPKDQPFLLVMCLPEPHGQAGPWNYRDPDFELEAPSGPPSKPQTMTQEAYDRLPEAIKNSRNVHYRAAYYRGDRTYSKYMATVRDYTARADLSVKRIRQALKNLGVEDNTVVIFSSDHGTMWGAHGIAGKWNMYEESIRMPMIIYDPRLPKITGGSRDQMVLNIDVAPTIVDLAGLSVPDAMQGMSLVPMLSDSKVTGHQEWYYYHNVFSRARGNPLPKCEGVRSERWKYIHYLDTDPIQEELFDLQADPHEQNSLVDNVEYSSILDQLRTSCAEFRTSVK